MSLGGTEIDFCAADEPTVELGRRRCRWRRRRRRDRRGRRGGTGSRFLFTRGLAAFTITSIKNVPEQFRVLLLSELGLGFRSDAAVGARPAGNSRGSWSA